MEIIIVAKGQHRVVAGFRQLKRVAATLAEHILDKCVSEVVGRFIGFAINVFAF